MVPMCEDAVSVAMESAIKRLALHLCLLLPLTHMSVM